MRLIQVPKDAMSSSILTKSILKELTVDARLRLNSPIWIREWSHRREKRQQKCFFRAFLKTKNLITNRAKKTNTASSQSYWTIRLSKLLWSRLRILAKKGSSLAMRSWMKRANKVRKNFCTVKSSHLNHRLSRNLVFQQKYLRLAILEGFPTMDQLNSNHLNAEYHWQASDTPKKC